VRIISLASGSKGNATFVESDGASLLIDCGLAYRTLKARLAAFSLALPKAVLLTHSHTDHVGGLATYLKHNAGATLYANMMTAEAVAEAGGLDASAFVCFENGQSFDIGPFTVQAFSIPHDTSDPVGYLIRAEGVTYFHGTDIGTPLDSIGVKLAEADVATLESNHDLALLRASQRPACLIQRIAGPRGHLSNDQSCELVRRFARPRLVALALAHLSQDCNEPHIALGAMRETLARIGRADLHPLVLSQDIPLSVYPPAQPSVCHA